MEFDEVREYVPGDDIRDIDWNVTARAGRPYIKRFSEERELTVIFLVDISGSMGCGSLKKSKAELAAELTGLLALSAIKNQDKIGLVLFSDRIDRYIPPGKGRTAVMRLVREVLAAEETRRSTDIALALDFLNRVQKRRSVVFLISDFNAEGYEQALRVTARRHDLIGCAISDPLEQKIPNVGLIEVVNPETGALTLLDTGSSAWRSHFQAAASSSLAELDRQLRRLDIDFLSLTTDKPFVDELLRLFRLRQLRAGRGQHRSSRKV